MTSVSPRKLAFTAIAAVAVGLAIAWAYAASGSAPERPAATPAWESERPVSARRPESEPPLRAQRPQPAAEGGKAHSFDVQPFARGINRPTYVGAAPGDADGIWVLEQPGRVIRISEGRRETLLDLRRQVRLGAEQGLLGIAFHPDFARNRRLYLHWSDRRGHTRVGEFRAGRRFRIGGRPSRRLLFQRQPEENHNGGQLAFGPDGRLYLGLGDGGGALDPYRTAQDPRSRLGKIIATRVDGRPRWQTVVSGLRNPWRFAFDPALNDLWIADVGQNRYEEINRIELELDEPPKNAGWSVYEGMLRTPGRHKLDRRGELVWPVAGYTHEDGCSVTGGHVYAGTALRALQRRYVYGDYCTGALWSLRGTADRRATDVRREAAQLPQLTHIGADAQGELVFASGAGVLYRAVPTGSGR
jgi:glucose/arabinose dehydrogenase